MIVEINIGRFCFVSILNNLKTGQKLGILILTAFIAMGSMLRPFKIGV